MSFVISLVHCRQCNLAQYVSAHQFQFNGSATGLGLADFMLGRPSQLITGRTNPHHVNGTSLGLYAVDTWRVMPKLTLNYGVRWQRRFRQMWKIFTTSITAGFSKVLRVAFS